MRKEKELKEAYDELNKKCLQLSGEKAELEYQLSMLKEETKHLKQQDDEIRELYQKIRQLKHDMKNHLMVIAAYINDEEYMQAKEYTSDILGKLNAMHSYIETGNSLLNHIVNEKLELARKEGIAIKAEIENLQFKKLSSMDFSALLSNLLDNAIEASISVKGSLLNREIQLIISQCRGYETICVKNRIEKSVLKENPQLQSTKDSHEAHGLGISKIKAVIDECGGMYDFYEEDDFFCVKVFIPV